MGIAPRQWQMNLSNLSVTSKVGIVLLLPVVLASVFAVLRINDELGTISQLNAASEQARIIRPTLAFSSATNALAVATGSSNHPLPNAGTTQTALDQAAAKYDQTAADLQTALQNTATDRQVITELTEALAAGKTLRNSVHGTAVQETLREVGDVSTHIGAAISELSTPNQADIERYFTQLGVIETARQSFTQQELALNSGGLANNAAAVAPVLTAAGSELTMINQYASIRPDAAKNSDVLRGAVQTRIGALSQNTTEPVRLPGVAQSMQLSTDGYNEVTGGLADLIDSGLSDRSVAARATVLRDVALAVVTLLAGLALALSVARSLVVPIRRLRHDSLQVAHTDLPAELEVVRNGGSTPEIVPVDVQTKEEIGQLARAVDDMHRQALHLAADQARLRMQIGTMFETLSRRSQTLVEQQLSLIEDLERDEDDPGRLQSMFRLDHLATRMRRNGDNLLVLAGTALRRGYLPPVPLSDMLWSAVSQVEDYQRVEIGSVPDGIVEGEPAVDIEHLLAELIDNSLRYSPPNTPVAVAVSRAVDGGYLIEITDRGLGMSAEDLKSTNDRLASGGEVNLETARRMGLFVVGRLASRHNITATLRRSSSMAQQPGITACVHLPGVLVSPTEAVAPPPITSTYSGSVAEFPAPAAALPAPTPIRPLAAVPDRPDEPDEDRPNSDYFATGGLPQRKPSPPVEPDSSGQVRQFPAMGQREIELGRSVGEDLPTTGQDFFAEPSSLEDAPASAPSSGTWVPRKELERRRDGDFPSMPGREPGSGTGFLPRRDSGPQTGGFGHDFGNGYDRNGGDHQDRQHGNGLTPMPAAELQDERAGGDHRGSGEDRAPRRDPIPPAPRRPAPAASERSRPQPASPDSWADTAIMAPSRRAPDRELPRRGGTRTAPRQAPGAPARPESPTPIYQRMVSEWLVEPSDDSPTTGTWSSTEADQGWAAAQEASAPVATTRTQGGLPIRRPGAQLVPGGVAQDNPTEDRNPEEIRKSLSSHLSGVRRGRVNAQQNDAQQNDGGFA